MNIAWGALNAGLQSVLDTASIPHQVFLVLGMGDFAVRYAVLRRRAA